MTEPKKMFNIRVTPEAANMLRAMAQLDKRDYGDEFEVIIRAEWERRHPEQVAEPAKSNKK